MRVNDILLTVNSQIPDFTVIDGNACNSDGAMYNLPNGALFDEELGDDGEWAVFIRMRGQPSTGINMTLCYTEADQNNIVCDTGDSVDAVRGNGKPKVTDVTRALLGFDQTPANTPNPWWDVSTNGRAKATLYFYDCDDLPIGVGQACS